MACFQCFPKTSSRSAESNLPFHELAIEDGVSWVCFCVCEYNYTYVWKQTLYWHEANLIPASHYAASRTIHQCLPLSMTFWLTWDLCSDKLSQKTCSSAVVKVSCPFHGGTDVPVWSLALSCESLCQLCCLWHDRHWRGSGSMSGLVKEL